MNITSVGEILFDIYPNHKRLGGAPLNFIYHVKKLTDGGNLISRVGKDILGNKAVTELNRAGISTEYIQLDNQHSTGITMVTLDKKGVPDFKINFDSAYDYIELDQKSDNLVNTETDCLYFGTLAQFAETSRRTIQSFFNRGIKYFTDINLRQNFFNEEILRTTLKAADFIKVSYEEMHVLNDFFLKTEYSTEKVALELMEEFNLNLIAVTRGKDGASIFENGKTYNLSSTNTKAVDTTGAGDAFSAILCLGYLYGLDTPLINKIAIDFASEICQIEGAIPKNDRIYDDYRNQLGIY